MALTYIICTTAAAQTLYILKINARKIFVPVWRGWALGGANYVGSVSIIQQTLLTTNLGDIDIDILKHIDIDILQNV